MALTKDGNYVFVARNGGRLFQEVDLPETHGKYVLITARVSCERIHEDDERTGRPYIYAYALGRHSRAIQKSLQKRELMLSTKIANDWELLYAIFEIPPETGGFRFFMHQAHKHYMFDT